MRFALGIEYDGSDFHGWQNQSGMRTIQHCLEQTLSKIANQPIMVVVAGRTDAGVHAGENGNYGQVVHFDSDNYRTARAWVLGGNAYLPPDIAICWACQVHDDFHARFSARSRHYRYIIHNSFVRSALNRNYLTWERRPLQVAIMSSAANYLIGTHDFSSFRAQGCQAKSPIRSIHKLTVIRNDNRVIIDIIANAFLHHMVRNIAGVLMTIGAGEQPPEWTQILLAQRDRTRGGVTAPAAGLYLINVEYPPYFGIPPSTAF